jgi:hypothetical protein
VTNRAGAQLERKIVRVFYSKSTDRVRIIFDDRTIYVIPRRLMEGLESANTQQLKRIEILETGPTIHWPLLAVKHSVPKLLSGEYGGKHWMASLERMPKTRSPREEMRAAERARSVPMRRFLGDDFVVMTNAAAEKRKLK